MKKLRGILRYGWPNSQPERDPATFVLFPPEGPGIEVRDQLGKPFSPDQLVSYVNLEVEVRGEQAGNVFRLLEIQRVAA